MAHWMVGIDTGGTFTDLVAFEADTHDIRTFKVASVPSDPSSAVIAALRELFATGVTPAEVGFLVHGTTAATNTLLEGKGVCTGLLITEGFRGGLRGRQRQTAGFDEASRCGVSETAAARFPVVDRGDHRAR